MAFERTSNDALAPFISPSFAYQNIDPFTSTSSRVMSAIVHKQTHAMAQLHSAFAAEREAWVMERDNLYQRIRSLEKLLITNSAHRCVSILTLLQSGALLTEI
jgi:hypothetical protein